MFGPYLWGSMDAVLVCRSNEGTSDRNARLPKELQLATAPFVKRGALAAIMAIAVASLLVYGWIDLETAARAR